MIENKAFSAKNIGLINGKERLICDNNWIIKMVCQGSREAAHG